VNTAATIFGVCVSARERVARARCVERSDRAR